MKITFIHFGYESLAVEFLTTALKAEGHEVNLVFEADLFNRFYGRIGFLNRDVLLKTAKEALATKPNLICFSATTDNIAKILKTAKLIKELKEKNTHIPIVLGGIAPTIDADNIIAKKYVDFVCVGDGTVALPKLATAIAKRKTFKPIYNIVYRANAEVVKKPIKEQCDLFAENILPSKDIFYNKCKGLVTPIYKTIFTTGCVYNCSYCHNSFFKNLYIQKQNNFYIRNRDALIKELTIAKKKYNPKIIYFLDDCFLYDKQATFAMLEIYREKIALPFICAVHPDFIDAETAEILRKSGCVEVSMGFQSADEDISKKVLNRVSSKEKTKEAVAHLKQNNIFTNVDIILNIPTETKDTLKANAIFLNEAKPDAVITFYLKYYPNMPITKEAIAKGLLPNDIKPDENGVISDTRDKDKKLTLLIKCSPYLNKKLFSFFMREDTNDFAKTIKVFLLSLILIAYKFIKANPFNKRKKLTITAMLNELYIHLFYMLKFFKR